MEVFLLIGRLGQVYGGIVLINFAVDMYDSGQSLPMITEAPQVTSLFILVLLAIIFMVQ